MKTLKTTTIVVHFMQGIPIYTYNNFRHFHADTVKQIIFH